MSSCKTNEPRSASFAGLQVYVAVISRQAKRVGVAFLDLLLFALPNRDVQKRGNPKNTVLLDTETLKRSRNVIPHRKCGVLASSKNIPPSPSPLRTATPPPPSTALYATHYTLLRSAPPESAPLRSIPLHSTPFESKPLHPLHSTKRDAHPCAQMRAAKDVGGSKPGVDLCSDISSRRDAHARM